MALAGYLGLVSYDLSTYCATDPPPMPVIGTGDWIAAFTLSDPVAHLAAIQKFQDMLGNFFWPTFCQCNSVATPAPPPLPSPPPDLPTVGPTVLPTAPVAGPCWDKSAHCTWLDSSAFPYPNLSQQLIPTSGPSIVVDCSAGGFGTVTMYPVPGDVIGGTSHVTFPGPLGGGGVFALYANPAGTYSAWQRLAESNAQNTTFTVNLTVGQNDPYWAIVATPLNQGNTAHADIEILLDCTAGNPPLQNPCCPPDESQQALLQSILSLVQGLYENQATPLHSYSQGTVHTGLTGSGSIVVAGTTIAIEVQITTFPPSIGQAVGNPTYYFDVGWITPLAAGNPYSPQRIVYQQQLFIPNPLTDEIAYTLEKGVVANIVELSRGP